MYAKYVSNTASVQAQVINDLALLLSGSPISALSASCDKVNTTLLSTVAPGWTLVDSTALNSGSVITAPDADASTTKAVRIYAPTAVLIGLQGSESWDAGAHTGVNPTNAVSNSIAYSATVANTYVLFATARSFWMCLPTGVGAGALEFTRDCSYLQGTTYPCFAIMSSVTLAGAVTASYAPRLKSLTAAGDVITTVATVLPATLSTKYIGYATPGKAPAALRDVAENPYYEIRPVWASTTVSTYAAILGKFYDILEIASVAGNTLDTFSDGTDTYAVINMAPSAYAFKMA